MNQDWIISLLILCSLLTKLSFHFSGMANAKDFDVNVDVDETVVDEDPNVKAAMAVNERNEAMKEEL